MSHSDSFLCPVCGWTGSRSDVVAFDGAVECPICEALVERGYEEEETTDSEPVLCPMCGWTGEEDDLQPFDEESRCPICAERIEYVE